MHQQLFNYTHTPHLIMGQVFYGTDRDPPDPFTFVDPFDPFDPWPMTHWPIVCCFALFGAECRHRCRKRQWIVCIGTCYYIRHTNTASGQAVAISTLTLDEQAYTYVRLSLWGDVMCLLLQSVWHTSFTKSNELLTAFTRWRSVAAQGLFNTVPVTPVQ